MKNAKHKITTRQVGGKPVERVYRSLIRQAVLMTLKNEGAGLPCVVSVLITDDEGIKAYNSKYRGKKRATDVLSFPMQEFYGAGWSGLLTPDTDIDTNTVPLGDIIISITTIKRHARRYKVTPEEETVRMIVHSTLHLLGYDHGDIMQYKEDRLMSGMGYFNWELGSDK